jgi:hypothetical protein
VIPITDLGTVVLSKSRNAGRYMIQKRDGVRSWAWFGDESGSTQAIISDDEVLFQNMAKGVHPYHKLVGERK